MSGHVFGKHLLYKLQLDAVDDGAVSGGAIKEGHATWNFVTGDCTAGVRFGQGKALYGFEGTGVSSGNFFVETSATTGAPSLAPTPSATAAAPSAQRVDIDGVPIVE